MWFWIIGGGLLLLVVALLMWARYLWNRGEELMSEVSKLGRQVDQLGALLEQIQPEPDEAGRAAVRERTAERRQPA